MRIFQLMNYLSRKRGQEFIFHVRLPDGKERQAFGIGNARMTGCLSAFSVSGKGRRAEASKCVYCNGEGEFK